MRDFDNLYLILLNIGRSVHNGDWNWKGISSPFSRLFYVSEGSARVNLPSGTHELKPQHLYFIPPFTLHSYECDSHFSHVYIHIYEQQLAHSSILEEMNFPVELNANQLDIMLIERLLYINQGRRLTQYDPNAYDNPPTLLKNIAQDKQQPEYAALETRGILSQLLSRFLKFASAKSSFTDDRILKVLKFIRNNIDKPIKISDLSDIYHLSDDHFIRIFKKEMQCTPVQYINRKKIERAQQMLIIENTAIKDVAYSLSFENISYFNRLFKQLTNYTPTQYCENIKNANSTTGYQHS
jgi:AraC-type DNA-binding domain-containing proteins